MKSIRKLKEYISPKIEAETPSNITYHGLHHTLDVLRVCNQYIKRLKIPSKEAYLLRTAALLHDYGIMEDYSNHEKKGAEFAKKILPDWGYSQKEIEIICDLILATKIPQSPKTKLEKIICDADLDYLGTDQFYEIGDTLYQELKSFNIVKNEEEWDRLQVDFLKKHSYHTEFATKNRMPTKKKYYKELKKKWGWD